MHKPRRAQILCCMGKLQPQSRKVIHRFILSVFCMCLGVQNLRCTYDSTPPGDDKINDGKPLLMLDLSGFNGQRAVKIQYSDLAGSTTLSTAAEKTDASGRILYPLYLTRGTRTYSLTITIDQNNNGTFGDTGDYSYATGSVTGILSDTDVRNVKLTITAFTAL